MATYMNGHHGNIHVCVHFLHSPWQHTCGTASSNVIRYRWVADEPRILCCVHQTILLWLHMCHCLYGANSYATILRHMQVIITMATHMSILYGASCICTSVSACRWPSWTQEPLNLQGGKTIDHKWHRTKRENTQSIDHMTSGVELHSLTEWCFHTFYEATSMQRM